MFSRATNVCAAFEEARDILKKQVEECVWEKTLLESARSSLIFEVIDNEKTVGHVVEQSLISYFKNVDYSYNRWLVEKISKVTEEDLNRVGKSYVEQLFNPSKTRTTLVCHPSKTEPVLQHFNNMGYNFTHYPNLEKSLFSENDS